MAGHIFISYSRVDQPYARALAEYLRRQGLVPWIDDRIDYGDRWWRVIDQQIRTCGAFVVVMTPDAWGSDWVHREILLALLVEKPILPLLLSGPPFSLLIDRQPIDVSDGSLPGERFCGRLRRVLGVELPPAPPPKAVASARTPSVASARTPPGERAAEGARSPSRVPSAPRAASVPLPEMIPIPAGTFLMGSDPEVDSQTYPDEQPQHELFLPDYSIAKTPVTNAHYRAFVQAAGHRLPEHWENGNVPQGKENHPVVYVSWHDARAYCDWLAGVTQAPYRLSSEAEWEKAARGTKGWIYPWGDQWDASRCNAEMRLGDTSPVDAYPRGASPYGLLDMAGNVWEWTRSLWGKGISEPDFKYPYEPGDGREDRSAADDILRVLRGGAFSHGASIVRCASRHRFVPGLWLRYSGFRVVLASPG